MASTGRAQVATDGESVRPDAVVRIEPTTGNAEMVQISVRDANYPPKLLVAQAANVGKELGGTTRGIRVSTTKINEADPHSSTLLDAVFAVDGLVDHTHKLLKIGPVVKAMAGAPAPYTVSGLFIDFDGAQVGPETLDSFESKSVSVARHSSHQGVEYEVQILNQDPTQIDVPDGAAPAAGKPASKPTHGIDWVVYVVYTIGALFVGALVYCLLLLRPSQRPKSRA
jgi:hypothetical protein